MNLDELKKIQESIIKRKKIIDLIFICLLISFVVIIFGLNQFRLDNIFIVLFYSFFGIVFLFVVNIFVKNLILGKDILLFRKNFKKIFVLDSLNKIFEDIKFDYNKGLDKAFLSNTGMIYTGDRFRANDYVSGKYKKVGFEQSDIHIEEEREETDSDGNKTTYWVTIFFGRWMVFDFNKKFKSNLSIVSKKNGANVFRDRNMYSRIKLEDDEFNKKFIVYAHNEEEAFYILTPHFMERIKKVYDELNCGIILCFVSNKLHIGVNNYKDSFECNVYKPINEKMIEEGIMSDIKVITDLVDELNLDNDLFKMEG